MTYQVLDPAISYGAVGGPEFVTVIATTESGDESREAMRSKALGTWDISYAARLESKWRPLQAFFLAHRGRRDPFAFKDWTDFTCTQTQSVLTTLSTNTRQMWKRYAAGSLTYDKKLVLPKSGTLTVVGTGTYTVDYNTGIITIVSGAAPTAFDCEFYKLVRFDTDVMKANTIDRSGNELVVGWSGIPIKEVKG